MFRVLAGAFAAAAFLTGAAQAAAPTAQDLTRRAAIEDVSISNDGRHIVALTSPDGESVNISVWRTEATNQPPVNIGSKFMRFLSVSFLKDDRLLVTAIQPIDVGSTRGHVVKHYVTDLEGKAFTTLLPETRALKPEDEALADRLSDSELISSLPRDARHVLVEDDRTAGQGDIYRVDIYSGSSERIMRGSERFFGYRADLTGELRTRQELNFEGGKVYLAQWIRNPVSGVWEEHFRDYAKDRDDTSIVGFTPDPNILYVRSSRGTEKAEIYEYDIKQRKLLDPAFAHKLFDAGEGVYLSRDPATYGQLLGVSLLDQTSDIFWLDERMQAMAKGVDAALGITPAVVAWTDPGSGLKARIPVPSDAQTQIISASNDLKFVIVEKSGPRQPAEYYLLTDGTKLALLGKARPWIDPASLGTTQLVEYPARDGLMIPAFLTTPPKDKFGPGPWPTLIEPHGGPWARDDMEWDVAGWVQYFASRGFAVLQPQFRGSEGWGQKLWRAGDGEWGQKMQDDKDDGVRWLQDQHIAAPGRVAMFGYSYGGYAALAASIRPKGLYACAISGAGAGDLGEISRATFDNRFQREFQHPTIGGLDALAHAREAQIPVFLYHGDRDQTVDVEQSRKFSAALKAAGKPYRYLEIKDMGHQYVTMTPAMMTEQLNAVDDFLKTACKPGGL